ncbi:MAG: tetratricopeptide repeat protein [Planctomycetota bacterium]
MDLYFKGEFEEAKAALEKVLERDPENSEARILLGDACRELGDLSEAHKHHYQVAEVFGQDLPRNRLSLGKDLLAMGRSEEAVPHLAKAAEADPDDRVAAELLLSALLEAGHLRKAVSLAKRLSEGLDGEEAERARRRHATVLALAGRESVEQGDVREGGQLLRSALKLNPSLVAPRLEIVRAAYLHGSPRAAEKELLAHLKEMSKLAEDGGIVFEPPASPLRPAALPRAAAAPDEAPAPALAAPAAGALPPPDAGEAGVPAGALAAPAEAVASSVPAVAVPSATLPRGPADGLPDAPAAVEAGALVRTLLPRQATYLCGVCGRAEVVFSEVCPGCGEFGTLLAADETPLVPVSGMREILDEVQENRAFIRSLVRRAAQGDELAAARLVRNGRRAVNAIFRELLRLPDSARLVRVLSDMGPEAVPAIIGGYRKAHAFSAKRLVREGMRAFRSLDDVVTRALAGMGEDVLPALDPLVESEEKDLVLLGLDVLIRLGRADRVEAMRLAVSSKEILDRLNSCPKEELGPFLDACPEEGFLADQVLVDRTFAAEEALVDALARPDNAKKMRRVLMSRGFSSRTYEALEAHWGEPALRTLVSDVVRSYGRSAADHLLKTYTTSTLPEETRENALRLFLDLGGEEVERLVERLSEGDSEMESAVLRIILAFGSRAVPALTRAYGKTGLLEKVGLNRRRLLYRKTTLIRALGQIGSYDAVQGLRRIHEKEADPELKRKIRGVLGRIAGGRESR